ncbi:hypothetical protein [Mycobacterium malmoense]|uniref:hypothetical protein n=1 Tax=Mycobacterium malmoense TaxID=1780 RepID=UPI0008F87877|nr:hypothetical protein [Mycobacterium malmoense]OIN80760.1 hypothetical protein BMG05_10460 [Mycobacterium malmoense]
MTKLVGFLVLCAAGATGYATVAFLTGHDSDFQIAALLAAACLFDVLLLDRVDYLRRRRIIDRAETWARRERESDQS